MQFLFLHRYTAPSHARKHTIQFDGEPLNLFLRLLLCTRLALRLLGLGLDNADLALFFSRQRFSHRTHQVEGLAP